MSPSGSVRPPEGPVSWARRWPWLSGLVVAAIFFGLGPAPTDHSGGYQGPQYLMLITRKALYTPRIVDVRARLQPIFTIQRQKATLLEIYRLQ
jgi:hypothetical protein